MRLEDTLLAVARNTRALVADAHARLLVFDPQTDLDLPAIGVLDRIPKQIRENLSQPVAVAHGQYRCLWRVEQDLVAIGLCPRQLDLLAGDLDQVAGDR